jgi:hypothetical protein
MNWPIRWRRVAVAADADRHQRPVGEHRARRHGGHAAVHGVEAMGEAQKISGDFEEHPMPEIRDRPRLDSHLEKHSTGRSEMSYVPAQGVVLAHLRLPTSRPAGPLSEAV